MYRYIKSSSSLNSDLDEFEKIIKRIKDELGPEYKVSSRQYSGIPLDDNEDIKYRIEVEDPEGYESAFEVNISDIDYDSIMNKIQNQLSDSREFDIRYSY